VKIDKKVFLDTLGGPEAAARMDSEARADALESHMMTKLNESNAANQGAQNSEPKKYPSVAEVEAQIETRKYRDGVGFLYVPRSRENVRKLAAMPANPTIPANSRAASCVLRVFDTRLSPASGSGCRTSGRAHRSAGRLARRVP